jgi:3-hydroxyisobutyrate dehydrogenase-like beta-hydroxyacid dehydrogenase
VGAAKGDDSTHRSPAARRNKTLRRSAATQTLEAMRPVLEAMGEHIHHFGGVGAGHTAKVIQNMIGTVASAGIAEGFVLAKAAGLDVEQFFKMLTTSTANSPALQHNVPKIFAREFDKVGFRLDLAYKDIRQATALARELTVPLFAANGATELMQIARATGSGHLDQTAIIRGLETVVGIEVRPKPKT